MKRIPLGSSPSTGSSSVNQCQAFKRLVRESLGSVAGVSLLTVRDGERFGVEAVVTSESPLNHAWAREASALADHAWGVVAVSNHRELVCG